jgi:hypothetical protein
MITQEQRDKVAVEIMGWDYTPERIEPFGVDGVINKYAAEYKKDGKHICYQFEYVPDSDQAPAWQLLGVIEAMREKGFSASMQDHVSTPDPPQYGFQFWKTGNRIKYCYAGNFPEAVILAALATVESVKEKV